MLTNNFLIAFAAVIFGRCIILELKKSYRRYKRMKKFSYGFDATKQERNTINRQINRMEKRGYIFPEDIRKEIKTTKKLPEFLYKHSEFRPFIRGSTEKRVMWSIPGELGKELEEAVNKVNRENRMLYKKGLLTDKIVVHPSGVSGVPGPWEKTVFRKSKGTITKEAVEAVGEFIKKSKESGEQRLKRKLEKDRDRFTKRVEDLFTTYLTDRTDIEERNKLRDEIVRRLKGMSPEEWLHFSRTTRFNIRIWFDSKTKDKHIAANIEDLMRDLGMHITKRRRDVLDELEDALLLLEV